MVPAHHDPTRRGLLGGVINDDGHLDQQVAGIDPDYFAKTSNMHRVKHTHERENGCDDRPNLIGSNRQVRLGRISVSIGMRKPSQMQTRSGGASRVSGSLQSN